ncbi:MAG: hypothetical protein KF777_08885 [Planctomycetaceae bacterium]|nr:hypothetical protein [Planctomycetaceae bacterium]
MSRQLTQSTVLLDSRLSTLDFYCMVRLMAWAPARTGWLFRLATFLGVALVSCAVHAEAAAVAPRPKAQSWQTVFDFGNDCDADLDDQPDDWVRRSGSHFPHYVRSGIDRQVGFRAPGSLRIDANAGQAVIYSPPIPVDDLHAFEFEGAIRVSGLKSGAAMLSVSLLNDRRDRLVRQLSQPVSDTGEGWYAVRLGPIAPPEGTRFVVIGCHLLEGAGPDIGGQVWFDDLRMAQRPRMVIKSDAPLSLFDETSPLSVTARVSGLTAETPFELRLQLFDLSDRELETITFPLGSMSPDDPGISSWRETKWEIPRQPTGYYRVVANLLVDQTTLAVVETTFAVTQIATTTRPAGEFGWSLEQLPPQAQFTELAMQSGLHAVKIPLWNQGARPRGDQDAATLIDELQRKNIETIGLLDVPPVALREKFTQDWRGVSELFVLPAEFWGPSLRPVMARYGAHVRYWQLGSDRDRSFVGVSDFMGLLRKVHHEFGKVGVVAELGVPWSLDSSDRFHYPAGTSFVSIPLAEESDSGTLIDQPVAISVAPLDVSVTGNTFWAVVDARDLLKRPREQRAAALARQTIRARISGAQKVFFQGAFDADAGLTTESLAPTPLYLPWRTLALSLQQADYHGELVLPGGSRNAVFVRDGEAIVLVWNDVPGEERCCLGDKPRMVDLYGRPGKLVADQDGVEHRFAVGPEPVLLFTANPQLVKWQVAMQFAAGKMASEFGGHRDELIGVNVFPQGANGSVTFDPPHDWTIEPGRVEFQVAAGEAYARPFTMVIPAQVTLGEHLIAMNVELMTDRLHKFRVYRRYQVGLGDVEIEVIDRRLPDGRLEIEQIVTNRTKPLEVLDYRCTLFVPNSRRQRLTITRLGDGQDRKVYHLPDADALRGKELWLRLDQEGGRRVMNYRWTVGQEW